MGKSRADKGISQFINNIICGDSAIVLQNIPDNSVDLIVTSPPYDGHILRKYNGFPFTFIKFKAIAREAYRVLKPGAVLIWIIGDAIINGSESGTSSRQKLFFKKIGFNIHDTMIYEKNSSSFPASRNGIRYSQTFEYIYVFSKGRPNNVHLISDKINRWAGHRGFGQATQRTVDGKLVSYNRKPTPNLSPRGDVWRYFTGKNYSSKDTVASEHPAIMPYLLAFDMIRTFSNEGDVVLDIFNGASTTTLMAKVLNRKYIGIEVSEEYCKIAEERLAQSNLYNVEDMIAQSSKEYNSRCRQDTKTKQGRRNKKSSNRWSLFVIKTPEQPHSPEPMRRAV